MAGNHDPEDSEDECTVEGELQFQADLFDAIQAEARARSRPKNKPKAKGKKKPLSKPFVTASDDSELEQDAPAPSAQGGQAPAVNRTPAQHAPAPSTQGGQVPAVNNRPASVPPTRALQRTVKDKLPITIPLRLVEGERPVDPRLERQPSLRFADYRLREWPSSVTSRGGSVPPPAPAAANNPVSAPAEPTATNTSMVAPTFSAASMGTGTHTSPVATPVVTTISTTPAMAPAFPAAPVALMAHSTPETGLTFSAAAPAAMGMPNTPAVAPNPLTMAPFTPAAAQNAPMPGLMLVDYVDPTGAQQQFQQQLQQQADDRIRYQLAQQLDLDAPPEEEPPAKSRRTARADNAGKHKTIKVLKVR